MARIDSLKPSITELSDRDALAIVRQVRESRVTLKKTINRRSPSITKAIKARTEVDKMINQAPEMAIAVLTKLLGGNDGGGTA